MGNIKLNVISRDSQSQNKSWVPAELYGPAVANQHLFIDEIEITGFLSKINKATLIDLLIDKNAAVPVLIREIQREPLKDKVLHVDFFQIDMKKKVKVEVDLDPVGRSTAINNLGATLVKNMQALKVESLPENLVAKIEIDLAKLVKVDDVIRVGDLILPSGLAAISHPRAVVFSLAASRKGRIAKPEEASVAPTIDATPVKEAAPAKVKERNKK